MTTPTVTPVSPAITAHPDPLVGCVCNGKGRLRDSSLRPFTCPHCHGNGSIPRTRYQQIKRNA